MIAPELSKTDKANTHFKFTEWDSNNYTQAYSSQDREFNKVVFFTTGQGTHQIAKVRYAIQPCSVHFVAKGLEHTIDNFYETAGFSLLLSETFYQRYLSEKIISTLPLKSNAAISPVINLNEHDFVTVAKLVEDVKNSFVLFAETLPGENIGNYMNIIFAYLQVLYLKNHTNNYEYTADKSRIIKAYTQLAGKHYKQHLSVQQYADILCTAPNYLNELCKKELGITAQQVGKELLMGEARKLLRNTDMEVKEICFELGFADPSQFSQFFKKYTGLAPTEFREAKL